MEELKNIGEQLEKNLLHSNVAEASLDKSAVSENIEGSPIGKFKDAKSLFSAYSELEKEFTKKCQKISELEKTKPDNTLDKVPCYLSENWRDEIKMFLNSHQKAQNYANEISQELMKDNELAKSSNALDLAYAKVLSKKFRTDEELLADESFVDKNILKNEKLKSKIIKDYLNEVSNKKTPPVVLNSKGSSLGFLEETKPKDFSEAQKLVEKMFNY